MFNIHRLVRILLLGIFKKLHNTYSVGADESPLLEMGVRKQQKLNVISSTSLVPKILVLQL